MQQIDWDRLRVFSKTAEMGSFSRASGVLHTSQSALSRQIALLEKALGCFLFKRVPRGLVLTAEGGILFNAVQEIVVRLATAEMTLLENKDSPRGIVRVEITHVLGTFWLPLQLLEFSARYPDIYFKLIFTDKRPDFSSKKVDISISLFSSSDPEVVCSDPIQSPVGIYASRPYLEARGMPEKISDLDHHRLIIMQNLEKGEPFLSELHWLLDIGRPEGKPRPVSLSFNNFQGLYYAAKNAIGIAQLPKFCIRPEDDLMELLSDIPQPLVSRYVICPLPALSLKRVFIFRNFILKKLTSFFSTL